MAASLKEGEVWGSGSSDASFVIHAAGPPHAAQRSNRLFSLITNYRCTDDQAFSICTPDAAGGI